MERIADADEQAVRRICDGDGCDIHCGGGGIAEHKRIDHGEHLHDDAFNQRRKHDEPERALICRNDAVFRGQLSGHGSSAKLLPLYFARAVHDHVRVCAVFLRDRDKQELAIALKGKLSVSGGHKESVAERECLAVEATHASDAGYTYKGVCIGNIASFCKVSTINLS